MHHQERWEKEGTDMNAVFSLLNQLSQTAWDRVTGAEQPKLYI